MRKFFTGPLLVMYIGFLLLGFGYGYYVNISRNVNDKVVAEKKPERQAMTQGMISPSTQMVFKTEYMACGHVKTVKRDASIDEVGMDEEQLKSKYDKKWQLQSFDSQMVVFYRTAEGYCPDHFIIKIDKDGYVGVFKNDADKGLQEIQKTDIFYGSLNEKQQKRLIENIVVESEDDVSRVLSDLST